MLGSCPVCLALTGIGQVLSNLENMLGQRQKGIELPSVAKTRKSFALSGAALNIPHFMV